MPNDIRQSPKYAEFIQKLGWHVEKVGKWYAFIRKFPLFGSLIKIQRISPPVPFSGIEKLAKKHRAFKTVIEFDYGKQLTADSLRQRAVRDKQLAISYKINYSPFLPTKTIIIDLTRTEKEIFNSFSSEKRRAIRKAEKNGVVVKEINDPKEFIWLKKHSLLEKFIYPFGAEREIKALWQTFSPKNTKTSIAYQKGKPLAGIFLLMYQNKAYYWMAAAINKGKKLFAPSLLVLKTLLSAKKAGCTEFDFEGIYDDRFPISSWKGFTKFKRGFGGKEVVFPVPITLN